MDTTSIRRKLEDLGRNDLATGPLAVAEGRIALGLKAPKAVLAVSPQAVSVLAVDWSGSLPPRLHKLDAVLNEEDIADVEIQMPVPEMVVLHGISLPERVSVKRSRIPVVRIGAARGFTIDLVLTEASDAIGIAASLARTLNTTSKKTADNERRLREIAAEQLGDDEARSDRIAFYFGTSLDEDLNRLRDVVFAISPGRIGVIDIGVFTGDADDDDTRVQDIEDISWGRVGLPPGTFLPFAAAGLVVRNLPGSLTMALRFADGERWTIRMFDPAGGRSAAEYYADLLQRLDRAIAEK